MAELVNLLNAAISADLGLEGSPPPWYLKMKKVIKLTDEDKFLIKYNSTREK